VTADDLAADAACREGEAMKVAITGASGLVRGSLARTLAGLKKKPVRVESGLFVCGDHRDTASLHGAMPSGRRAAEAVRGRIPRDLA
jgi:uncharacterized protein YbjT (DUF2867 family)